MLSGSEGYCWSLFVSHDFLLLFFFLCTLGYFLLYFSCISFLRLPSSSLYYILTSHLQANISPPFIFFTYLHHPCLPFISHLHPSPFLLLPQNPLHPLPSPSPIPPLPVTTLTSHQSSLLSLLPFLLISLVLLISPCHSLVLNHIIHSLLFDIHLFFSFILYSSSLLHFFFYLSHPNLSISRSCFFLVFFSF